MTEIIPEERAQSHRDAFLDALSIHDDLDEVEDEVFAVEEIPDAAPDDFTRQRVIAAYDRVQVWLLNDDGPLQAFYNAGETWGEPGDAETVAAEIGEVLDL